MNPYLEQGDEYMRAGEYASALAAYEKALQKDPDDAVLHNNLGAALQALGRLDESFLAYEKALRLAPELAVAICNQANILVQQDKPKEAADTYARALGMDPGLAEAWQNSGALAQQSGSKGRALVHYDRAISLQPDLIPALTARCQMYLDVERYDDALADIQAARRRDKYSPELRAMELEVLFHHQPEKAWQNAEEWAQEQPNHPRPIGILARLLAKQERYNQALEKLKSLPEEAFKEEWVRMLQAELLLSMGNPQAAEPLILDLGTKSPENPDCWLLRGRLLLQKDQAGAALIWFRKAANASPGNPAVYLLMAQAWRISGDRHRALAALDTVVSRHPKNEKARLDRARLLIELGRYEEALKDLNRIQQAKDQNPAIANLQGNCWSALGKTEKALQAWDQALMIDAGFGPALINRGRHFLLKGDLEIAIIDLRKALEHDKNDASLWRLYRDACKRTGRNAEQATAERVLATLVNQE